jgi:MerR family transcriptional regulator, light-induced transcriptional regulator
MPEARKHPIQVVARRTGLTPEVLRVWEKRYGLVEPGRTRTGRRVYSDADIERLRLVHRATLAGRRVGEVCRLSTASLEALTREDERAARVTPMTPLSGDAIGDNAPQMPLKDAIEAGVQTASAIVEEAMEAVRDLDGSRLDAVLNRALMAAGATTFGEQIMAPLLRRIGEQWELGRLDPYSEHLSIEVIRRMICRVFFWSNPDRSAPAIIVTTPAGQRHEMGALLVACVAQTEGWQVLFLGPDLPARDIARAADQGKAEVVALSIVYPPDDPRLNSELTELRRQLRKDVSVLAGGGAAPSYARALRRIRAEIIPDLAGLRTALQRIRAERTWERQGDK